MLLLLVYVVNGQLDDVREGLSVEEDQQAGDAIFEIDGVVVEEFASSDPSVVLAGRRDVGLCADDGDGDVVGVAVVAGPEQELACVVAAGRAGGEILVDVSLGAGFERLARGAEPVEQLNGAADAASNSRYLVF